MNPSGETMTSCGLDGSLAEMGCDQVHECSKSSLNFDFKIIFSVRCGQDKRVHYTDDFLRPFGGQIIRPPN
ncbi:hypothetical protein BpHYR1_011788 [Brachionus plicatilis]|uniref:Uncharacterized protein n=1 Tax=Brachionus plicatilis TaxID=10195 RepID=A0A3M7RTW9_BRAPC|nr:hypothetical protein BpHYR1_011788 [Brachionus plicatilis]